MRRAYDVCIFGAGPAGVATAIGLANLGVSAVVLDRPLKKKQWGGESFTGAIHEPLSALGLWERFAAAGHVPGYAQRMVWGGAPWIKDSIFNLYGSLWHVDRDRFDEDLREGVRSRGVSILKYSVLESLQRESEGWRIRLDGREIFAKFLVDATGRACAIARRLGARPRSYDRLIAFTAVIPRNRNPEFDHTMVLEATPHGWWYAAPVPKGHVLVFLTDADLAPRDLGRSMRTVAANSAFTAPRNSAGWLPVGDACAAHDPLCGWGVFRALSNGILAADAIARHVESGDDSLVEDYRRHCCREFEQYLEGLSRHYSYERRWISSPFWERRAHSAQTFN